MSDVLQWLQNWYISQVDGDWEHQYGVAIETLDNPGWKVTIDLQRTYLAQKEWYKITGTSPDGMNWEYEGFESIDRNFADDNWMHCRVEDEKFIGMGDSFKLIDILETFRTWAESEREKYLGE